MNPYHLAAAALLLAAPAVAKAPAIKADGWARAGASSSAAYIAIHNATRQSDRLLGASSPAARSVSIHNTVMDGGVMRMRSAGALTLAPNARIAMKPGGMHIMLMGLTAPLRPGTRLPLTLRFERAGNVQVSLPVLPSGSSGPKEARRGN